VILKQVLPLVLGAFLSGALFISFGLNFFIGVGVGIAVQYAVYYSFVNILNAVVALKNKKLENERIKEFSYQGLEVKCPCFKKHLDIVPIRLNTSNYYKCSDCGKGVSVIVSAETAVVTEPLASIELPKLSLRNATIT
jgi:hypothetical protein